MEQEINAYNIGVKQEQTNTDINDPIKPIKKIKTVLSPKKTNKNRFLKINQNIIIKIIISLFRHQSII